MVESAGSCPCSFPLTRARLCCGSSHLRKLQGTRGRGRKDKREKTGLRQEGQEGMSWRKMRERRNWGGRMREDWAAGCRELESWEG